MKEPKSESNLHAVDEGGSKFAKSSKLVALKDFRESRRGVLYLNVKKGDDVSKLDKTKLELLKSNGVI